MEAVTQGVLLVDGAGRCLEANPAAARLLGVDRERLRAGSWDGLGAEGGPALAALCAGRTEGPERFGWTRPDGDRRWLEGCAQPLPGGGALVCLDDRTQLHLQSRMLERDHDLELLRQRAEQLLQDSQARLERAERVANFGHWHLDLECQEIFASKSAGAIYGLTGDEWTLSRVQELPLPQYRPALEAALAGLIHRGQPYDVEFAIRRGNDDEWRYIHSLAEYDPARGVVFGVIQDITERRRAEDALRESEERYRTHFDRAGEGILVFSATGKVLEVNESFAQMHGYTVPEMQGMTLGDLDMPESGRLAPERMRRLLAGEVMTFQVDHWHKDGHALPLETCAGRIHLGGEPVVLAFHRDITERVALEAQLRHLAGALEQRVAERTAQLEAANREMEAFSYSVSHDLRAPLRSIDGFSQILQEDYRDRMDEAGRHYLDRIRQGTLRMGELIDDLLKLSKTSRSEPVRVDLDLSALCAEVADGLARACPERRVRVAIQPGLRLLADPNLMQVVLENLLGNAWKFTSRQEAPSIEVGATLAPDGERTFFIRDNGAGFDMQYADKLFSAFQRLHSAAEFDGTGIGLALVQRIIHRHQGRIWAEAEPGKGATFSFVLPGTGG